MMSDIDITDRIFKIKDYSIRKYCLNIYLSYQWQLATQQTYKEIYKRVDRISKIKNIMSKEIIHDGSQPIDWCKIGPHDRIKFIIPVGGLSKKKWWQFWKKDDLKKSEDQIRKLIYEHKEEVGWDNNTGELTINRKLPYNKEYWFPDNNSHKLYE